MSVKIKMTAIADKLRTLLGLSGTMGLDAMANNLDTAQEEVDTQSNLISQISSVLSGKTGGGGGIVPSGTKTITENGTYDVTSYASAEVAVPGTEPTGTKTITSNGTHDVAAYASAEVNVPGIVPTGTKTITANGTYDISAFASALVNVAGTGGGLPAGITAITYGTVTPSSDISDQVYVNHDLGVAPDFCIWWLDSAFLESAKTSAAIRGVILNTGTDAILNLHYVVCGFNASGKGDSSGSTLASQYYMTDRFINIRCDSTCMMRSGFKYHWVAGTLDFLT